MKSKLEQDQLPVKQDLLKSVADAAELEYDFCGILRIS